MNPTQIQAESAEEPMSSMQAEAADGLIGERLTEARRVELSDALAQVRQEKALRMASLRASIACAASFLLLGKLGLLIALTLGLVAGGIAFVVVKAGQERKMVPPIAEYSDQVLVACFGEAIADKQSLGERAKAAFTIGLMILIALIATVLFANRM
jgi:hypothetical protein